MVTKSADELLQLVNRIFVAAGASEAHAAEVSQHLVQASLSGVDTHGIWFVRHYVDSVRNGAIDPVAEPAILKESDTSVMVTGNWTFGQVAARFTLEKTMEKAKEMGIAIGGLVQAYHIGRLGHYTELASAEGLVALVCLGGQAVKEAHAAPFGGRERALHTNPLAAGFPGGGDDPAMMFDFATTAGAGAKVVQARDRGQQVQESFIIDKDGNPTTDPNDFFEGGAILPFGGHKGYGVMTLVDYLGWILLRSDKYGVDDPKRVFTAFSGTCMIVLRADLFQPLQEVTAMADEFAERLRSSAPAPGVDEVLAPGDMEARARRQRGRDGIPIEDDVWQWIVEAAEMVGIADLEA